MGETFLYDGSFPGLLTVLARVVPYQQLPAAIATTPPPQQGLFSALTTVATDELAAGAFAAELTDRLTPAALRCLRRVFLADQPQRELLICRFCLLAWHEGKRAGSLLAHPEVAPLWKLERQVVREAHRYLGFVRFREVRGGFFYAAISPEHRILPLIAPHFAARFHDQQWVIHDLRHNEGLIHDPGHCRWLLLPMTAHTEPEQTPEEETFQRLWQEYFTVLAIAERKNPKLQRGKVPLKLRPWLTEFGGSS